MQENLIEVVWTGIKTYIQTSLRRETLGMDLVSAAGVLLGSWLIIYLGRKIIDRLTAAAPSGDEEGKFHIDENMAQTLRVLLKTLLNYAVFISAAIAILYIFNFPIVNLEDLRALSGKLIQAFFIFAIAKGLLRIFRVLVEHIFRNFDEGKPFEEGKKRAKTLSALLLSIMRYTVYFIAGVMVLQTFGVQTSSIIASAGIAGLAVGFGAQNLVKDIISGFFIIFEDQFSVGEYVTVAEVTGTVEELGLRATTIREWTGHLHTIPNGEIGKVKNYERGPILAVVNVGISYDTNIDQAVDVLKRILEKIYHEQNNILEMPSVLGVDALAESSVDLLVTAKCTSGTQWAVQRELRKRIKEGLAAEGIDLAFPTRVVYHRADEEGRRITLETE